MGIIMMLILPENDISEVINNLLPKVDKPPEKPQKIKHNG